jgi:hypothetical protein
MFAGHDGVLLTAFSEDVIACFAWLSCSALIEHCLPTRVPSTARAHCCAAALVLAVHAFAAAIHLAFICLCIGDAIFLVNMGVGLHLETLKLVLGSNWWVMSKVVTAQVPWAVPALLLAPLVYMFIAWVLSRLLDRSAAMCGCSRIVIEESDFDARGWPVHGNSAYGRHPRHDRRVLLLLSTIAVLLLSQLHGRRSSTSSASNSCRGNEPRLQQQLRVNFVWELSSEIAREWRRSGDAANTSKVHVRVSPVPVQVEEPQQEKQQQWECPPQPDAILILLEGVRHADFPTSGKRRPPFLVSLQNRGMLAHARTYTTMPNTLKALWSVLCGIAPEPLHGSNHLREFEPENPLLRACLPHLLRQQRRRYRSVFIVGLRFHTRTL